MFDKMQTIDILLFLISGTIDGLLYIWTYDVKGSN